MEPRIVNATQEHRPPAFAEPPASGWLHIGAVVAPPSGPPFVHADPTRDALLARLGPLAAELARLDGVTRATVYRGVLIPPVKGPRPARFDVAVLVEARTPGRLAEIRGTPECERLLDAVRAGARAVHVMTARCVRSLGDVDRTRDGLFLFNHFVAPDPELAVALWEHLAGWYVAETGLDNSTLLAPEDGDADFALVNHARWDKGPVRLALEQVLRPSFHRYVRANLRANGVVAMPGLYRLAHA